MSKNRVLIFLAFTLLLSPFTMAAVTESGSILSSRDADPMTDDIIESSEWVEYAKIDGVVIEYRFEGCNSSEEMGYHNTNTVFFRLVNRNAKSVTVSWTTKLFFNGECSNCEKLERSEYQHSVELGSKETIEGNCDSRNSDISIPANFIIKYPGMSDTKLTNFELINLRVETQK